MQGTADRPLYVVTGVVLSRDELQLPGGRFKRSELGRLSRRLDDLAENGPPDKRPAKVAFGLTAEQFEQVGKDLSTPVGFSTLDVPRGDAVKKMARKLSIPLKIEEGSAEKLGDDKVEDELTDLTCGTALACLLRPAGYCLVPKPSGKEIVLAAVKSRPDLKEIWPVGRLAEKDLKELVPELYEFRNVNVQNATAAAALEAIGKRLKTPVLYDRVALARHGIDPSKAAVNFSNARTNYSLALKHMLFPAGLKFEIRVDEAGTPFMWVFTIKPL